MFPNLTPQTDDALAFMYRVLDEIQDKDFPKKAAAELKKVTKARKDLAERQTTLDAAEKDAEKAVLGAKATKSALDAELKVQKTKTTALDSERKAVADLKKSFEAEKKSTMDDLRAKLADAEVQYTAARKLKTASEGEMKRVKALEASLKPAQDLVDKMAALKA